MKMLKDEVIRLLKENDILKKEKAQWIKEKMNQEKIIHETLTKMNGSNNEYLEEIQRLREELKKCQ